MILIIGGAYQGKLQYALSRYQKNESDIYRCSQEDSAVPSGKAVIYHFEEWLLACTCKRSDPEQVIAGYLETLNDEIIICEDISCGIVPADPKLRIWRETVGRSLTALAIRADQVIRLFCGIPTILKGEERDEIEI